jgi:hypothetical protein
MPPVLWIGALRVAVYPNDHRPPHVHVIGHACEAVIILDRVTGTVVLRENYGFATRELARIARALVANLAALLSAWESKHGIR